MTAGLALIMMLLAWLLYRTIVDWRRWKREQAEWDRKIKEMWMRVLEADEDESH